MPLSHEQVVKAGKKTATIRWGNKQGKQSKTVVGFYRDRDGKTKPITKSIAELNRKKFVKSGRSFRGVEPKEDKTSIAQRLEDISENLAVAQNNLQALNELKRKLLRQVSDTNDIDRRIEEEKRRVAILKNKLRHLS
jgi:hypothetical protein